MKKILEVFGWFACIALLVGGIIFVYRNQSPPATSPPLVSRDTVEMQLTAEPKESFNVPATKLPEFTVDVSPLKFQRIAQSSKADLKNFVSAEITYHGEIKGKTNKLESEIDLNEEKHKLVVHPKDLPNFQPGKYRINLTLRTIEGNVNIEQDFTWGVIAVNTNKSIYKPGETVQLGFGVLDDGGNTMCMTGDDTAEVMATITSPEGKITNFSSNDGTIKDSGECGPITITNLADFQAIYKTTTAGIYQMKVTAVVKGESREIEDYFKVTTDMRFDIERTSFPTRIYPGSPYPVSFTVIPKQDYQGSVVDIVPANFKIEQIGNNGKVVTENEFKKISWNVKLKAGVPQIFTYFIKFPPISPEFYLVGPITIGDFKEARQWQVASDAINSTTGLVTYEDNAGSATWSHVWSGTTFSGQTNLSATPEDSRWFVEKSNPRTGEKLVGVWDESGGTRSLFVFRWSGTAWDPTPNITITTSMAADSSTRVMDIAYEENSGDALFIYGDSTNQLKYYRKPAGGAWTGPSNAGTSLDSRKRWVRAKSQLKSDDILVGFLNANSRIGALIWNGTTNSFGNQFEDDNTPVQTPTSTNLEEAFDIAWETQTGTPMIFWGDNANNIRYREFDGIAWTGETVMYSNPVNNVQWLTANADPRPSSNYIAIASQEANATPTCGFGMWTGTTAEAWPSTVSCSTNTLGRLLNVQFENDTGQAVWVYAASGTATQMSWRAWTAGNSAPGSSTTETGATTGNIESIQLYSDLNTTSMIALYAADSADAGGAGVQEDLDVYYRSWDGTAWSAHTSLYGRIQEPGENAEAYGFGFDRNLETQAAYTWFTNANNVVPGTALAAQDSPYTLTSANQQFRLRLLIYYPDVLAISGRNYRLQFVDPGVGTCDEPSGGTPSTWTNVGAPLSGTAISYNNNATPADGDNISNATGDPTYLGKTNVNQDYEEGNTSLTFTNSVSAMLGDQVAKWDFALVDNTTFDATPSTFCFRTVRDTNNLVLQIGTYPKITTAALNDVLIQGGSFLQGGSLIQ